MPPATSACRETSSSRRGPIDTGGDPPGFKIDDCTTQRNLDNKGRAQSKALGEAFRGVRVDRIAPPR